MFGDLEFLGWYTTGGVPDDSDSKIHRQVCVPLYFHCGGCVDFVEFVFLLSINRFL